MLKILVAGYGVLLLAASFLAIVRHIRWLLWCGMSVALGWVLTLLLTVPHLGWRHVQWGIFLADIGVLIAFALIGYRYRNRWTMTLTGIQLAAVALHIVYTVLPALSGAAYAGAGQILGWAVVLTLVLGASIAQRTPS